MTTDLLELVDKHLSAIAGVTVRDMPAVLWTGWTANLDATSGKSLGGSGAGWLLRRQDFGRPLSMSFLLGNLH
jgi:hypothetical protein